MDRAEESLSPLRVMIVEDDPTVAKLLEMVLRFLNVELMCTAPDGVEALRLLSEHDGRVNTIICDWNMPNMSGIALLREVRAADPNMQFLIVTGLATSEHVAQARSLNVNGFIAKPFYPETIRAKLQEVARALRATPVRTTLAV